LLVEQVLTKQAVLGLLGYRGQVAQMETVARKGMPARKVRVVRKVRLAQLQAVYQKVTLL
jgi:hypothetical protein